MYMYIHTYIYFFAQVLYWRDVPTDNSTLGPSSLACEPHVKQIFLAPKNTDVSALMLETELMILRRRSRRDVVRVQTKMFAVFWGRGSEKDLQIFWIVMCVPARSHDSTQKFITRKLLQSYPVAFMSKCELYECKLYLCKFYTDQIWIEESIFECDITVTVLCLVAIIIVLFWFSKSLVFRILYKSIQKLLQEQKSPQVA